MSVAALYWAMRQHTGKPALKAVLMVLADVANEAGESWYSQAKLSEFSEVPERTLRRYLEALEARGLLIRSARSPAPGGARVTDVYRLPLPATGQIGRRTTGQTDAPATGQAMAAYPTEQHPTEPSETSSPRAAAWNGGVLLDAWLRQRPEIARVLSARERGKLGAACARIAAEHKPEEVRLAWKGIALIAPFSMGQPWDPMDLERRFPTALLAGHQNGRQSGVESSAVAAPLTGKQFKAWLRLREAAEAEGMDPEAAATSTYEQARASA